MSDPSNPYGVPPQSQAPGQWDPFAPATQEGIAQQLREKAAEDRRHRHMLVALLFNNEIGRKWLADRLAAEPPSYAPGDGFDLVAWREGRKALLRELQAELDEATRPRAAMED